MNPTGPAIAEERFSLDDMISKYVAVLESVT